MLLNTDHRFQIKTVIVFLLVFSLMILGVFGRPLSSRQAFKVTVNEMNPFYEETYQGKDLCVYKVYQYLVKQCLLENPEFK